MSISLCPSPSLSPKHGHQTSLLIFDTPCQPWAAGQLQASRTNSSSRCSHLGIRQTFPGKTPSHLPKSNEGISKTVLEAKGSQGPWWCWHQTAPCCSVLAFPKALAGAGMPMLSTHWTPVHLGCSLFSIRRNQWNVAVPPQPEYLHVLEHTSSFCEPLKYLQRLASSTAICMASLCVSFPRPYWRKLISFLHFTSIQFHSPHSSLMIILLWETLLKWLPCSI